MSPVNTGQSKNKKYWRSVDQVENTPEFEKYLHREFQENASVFDDPVSRRNFLKLMGSSMAFAGVAGCGMLRRPSQKIMPFSKRPEEMIPGAANYYATAMSLGEDVTGLLVESHEGRPTKIEGNPLHSDNFGACGVFHQASVLGLYDPDRLGKPTYNNKALSIEEVEPKLTKLFKEWRGVSGEGVSIVTPIITSPTQARLLKKIKKNLPKAIIVEFESKSLENSYIGNFKISGKEVTPSFEVERADVIVSLDSDFLNTEVGALKNAKQFARRRDPEVSKDLNRLYSFEPQFSVTGTKADHHFPISFHDVEKVAFLIAAKLLEFKAKLKNASFLSSIESFLFDFRSKNKNILEEKVLNAITDDLLNHQGSSLVNIGYRHSEVSHALVMLINAALGNVGTTVQLGDRRFVDTFKPDARGFKGLELIAQKMKSGEVSNLILCGADILYDAPNKDELEAEFSKLKNIICLSEVRTLSSEKSHFVLPRTHYLENWSDVESLSGVKSVVQPLIRPMYQSLSDEELLNWVASGVKESGYELVQKTWGDAKSNSFQSKWKKWLHEGIIDKTKKASNVSKFDAKQILTDLQNFSKGVSSKKSDLYLTTDIDLKVYDGRFSNNGWLQELPDPISKLTWDNALWVGPGFAKKQNLENGDVVEIKTEQASVKAPVWIVPGQASNSIHIAKGYGRSIGKIESGCGVNANQLFSMNSVFCENASINKTGENYQLASTQDHGSMEGRPLVREATQKEYKEHPDFAKEMVEHPPLKSLWQEREYKDGYQWGMAIDLSRCNGCNACVVACQSENNIPIVGKEEILNGREMHWIRMDRYFEGENLDDPEVVNQPMTCMHCENAPCEQVCPVGATVHSDEGLNDMVYNRCIGTRYCSDNCPVKVRRFNWFDYHQKNPHSVDKDKKHLFDYFKEPDPAMQKQFNPDVTVRMRGVMEKCTFCIQRINKSRNDSKRNGRREIKDGEIKTACQQTCASEAIVFGNILDENSDVSKVKQRNRNYNLLAELNIKPRMSYLAGIRNPNPVLGEQV